VNRHHNVERLTNDELERVRRDLKVSLALTFPGSPVRVSIAAEMSAIDRELGKRTSNEDQTQGSHDRNR
jgi:hypothetical protein